MGSAIFITSTPEIVATDLFGRSATCFWSSCSVLAWCKDSAPSADLRRWFGHDPAKWKEFQRRYRAELTDNLAACQPLLYAARQGNITLLYSAHDTEHNSAVVLKSWLEEGMAEKKNRR
jgi:uncharacterized protein YeaO (DUF488 family)